MKKNFRQKKTRRSQKAFGAPPPVDNSQGLREDRQYNHPTKGLRSMPKDRLQNRWRRRRPFPGKQSSKGSRKRELSNLTSI